MGLMDTVQIPFISLSFFFFFFVSSSARWKCLFRFTYLGIERENAWMNV